MEGLIIGAKSKTPTEPSFDLVNGYNPYRYNRPIQPSNEEIMRVEDPDGYKQFFDGVTTGVKIK